MKEIDMTLARMTNEHSQRVKNVKIIMRRKRRYMMIITLKFILVVVAFALASMENVVIGSIAGSLVALVIMILDIVRGL